jgi:hypothetical protein
MRIFVDECVNRKLLSQFAKYDFTYIKDTPWRGTKNGALLSLVQAEYDVFLTTDRHFPKQQNLRKFNLTFVIMRGISNNIEDLLPLVPDTLTALDKIKENKPDPGTVYEITLRQN